MLQKPSRSSLSRAATAACDRLTADSQPQFVRTVAGHWFRVEHMPADHSCGFHGLGIDRRDASRALLEKSGHDSEVQGFVAADLAAALQTGERSSFPPAIRQDAQLWDALDAYYAAQQGLDEQRRQALDFLAEEGASASAAAEVGGRSSETVQLALQSFSARLKGEVAAAPSGPQKLRLMQFLGRAKTLLKDFEAALGRSVQATQSLEAHCHAQTDAYIQWVGSDHSFWLSFVRGCGGNDRGGGLLDALAKVFTLTVRVWSESVGSDGGDVVELVHEAAYGGRIVNLWYQGDHGHFDRLVQCSG